MQSVNVVSLKRGDFQCFSVCVSAAPTSYAWPAIHFAKYFFKFQFNSKLIRANRECGRNSFRYNYLREYGSILEETR